jgi:hypothetical protein
MRSDEALADRCFAMSAGVPVTAGCTGTARLAATNVLFSICAANCCVIVGNPMADTLQQMIEVQE